MYLLPKPRVLAYGGELPEDPLVTDRKKKLLAGDGVGQQVGSLVQQAPQVLSALGIGGGAAAGGAAAGGIAGFASAAGPVGLALAAGSMIGGKLRTGQVDSQGFAKSGVGNQVVSTVANLVDPIGNAVHAAGNLGRDDLNVAQKIAGFVPGLSTFATAGADEAAKQKALAEKRRRDAESNQVQNASATRSAYGGLAGGFKRGGLLPRAFALGGDLGDDAGRPVPLAPAAATARLAEQQSAATQRDWTLNYINSPMYRKRLIREQTQGEDHSDRANLLQAGATQQQRVQNVEQGGTHFTDSIAYKPGVYLGLNTYDPADTKAQPMFSNLRNLPLKTNDVILERNLPERYSTAPAHEYSHQSTTGTKGLSPYAQQGITQRVTPGTDQYLSKPTEIKSRMDAVRYEMQNQGLYNPGTQEFTPELLQKARENEAVKGNQNFIELQQILQGKDSKSLDQNLLWMFNNVATTSPAPASTGALTAAKGGLLPGKPQPAAAQNNALGSFQAGAVKALRKVLPINAAMLAQDLTGNKTPLTEKDLSGQEVNVMRAAARSAGQYNPAMKRPANELNYNNYPEVGGTRSPDPQNFKDLVHAVTNPAHRMQTTIGGAMLQQNGANTTLTDSFDFSGADANDARLAAKYKSGPTTAGQAAGRVLTQGKDQVYNNLRYLGTLGGSNVDGQGIPVKLNLGNLKRPRPGEFAQGGLLPTAQNVIATGALHAEKNGLAHPAAGKRGIPVLDAAGNKLAEVERDEWTLADQASAKLESLRQGGSLLALGKHVQRELLTNTIPSPRYAKRLLPTK